MISVDTPVLRNLDKFLKDSGTSLSKIHACLSDDSAELFRRSILRLHLMHYLSSNSSNGKTAVEALRIALFSAIPENYGESKSAHEYIPDFFEKVDVSLVQNLEDGYKLLGRYKDAKLVEANPKRSFSFVLQWLRNNVLHMHPLPLVPNIPAQQNAFNLAGAQFSFSTLTDSHKEEEYTILFKETGDYYVETLTSAYASYLFSTYYHQFS